MTPTFNKNGYDNISVFCSSGLYTICDKSWNNKWRALRQDLETIILEGKSVKLRLQ